MNSPVSEKAAFAYTAALNYLLSSANPNRKIYLGDTTIVYWAESENRRYASAFASLIVPEYLEEISTGQTGRQKAVERLNELAERIKHAKALDVSRLLKDWTRKPASMCSVWRPMPPASLCVSS